MRQAVLRLPPVTKEVKIPFSKAWSSLRMKKRLVSWRNPNLMWGNSRTRNMTKVQKYSISTKTSEIIKILTAEANWPKNSNPKPCGHLKILQTCTIKAMRIKIRECLGFHLRINKDSKTHRTVIYKGARLSRIPAKIIKKFSINSSKLDSSLQSILTIFQ